MALAKRRRKITKASDIKESPAEINEPVQTVVASSLDIHREGIFATGANDEKIESAETEESVVQERKVLDKENHERRFSLKKAVLWVWAVLVLTGIFFGMLYFAFQQGIRVGQERVKAQIVAQPTPVESSPTPVEVETSVYPIKVLNGSGIAGEAASVRTILEDNGYRVSDIGNAETSDYDKTVIQTKAEVNKGWVNELRVLLEDTYSISEEGLEESDDDVIIIVGSKKASE